MKAYIVTFTPATRIIVESDENPNNNPKLIEKIVETAVENIKKNGVETYLCGENAEIEADEECPAGTFDWDATHAI